MTTIRNEEINLDFRVLTVGDVVGGPGMERVKRSLRYLKRKYNADFVCRIDRKGFIHV